MCFEGLFKGGGGFAMTDVEGELVPERWRVEEEGAFTDSFGFGSWDCEGSIVSGRA